MLNERVNIQYSIDIEELPQEVVRLLQKTETLIKNMHKNEVGTLTATMPGEALSLNTLETVDSVRKQLASIDYVLNDIASIISGFLNLKLQENKPNAEVDIPAPPPEMVEEPPEIDSQLYENFSNLQQQISQFKDQIKP